MQERGNDLQELVNEIVYLPDFYQRRDVNQIQSGEVFDYANFFEIRTKLKEENQQIILFDYDDEDLLPPTLYDLAALPENSLILDTTGNSQINGTFVFDKGLYQPFFGLTYLTGELAVSTIDTFSYVLLPFKVQSVLQQGDKVLLQSVPFMAELRKATQI